jgi:histidinol-phosphatase
MAGNAVDQADIEFAHELATAAALAALPYAGGHVAHRAKADGSPVSDADLAAEEAMLTMLAAHRPADGVLTEESGQVASGRRRWLLDPIDGTVQFVAGGSNWGVHVALQVDGEVVLGIITRPLRAKRWWAARGHGAFADSDADPTARSTRLGTSATSRLRGARVGLYRAVDTVLPDVLARHGAATVSSGAHILELVEGRLDAIVSDRCGFPWDHAPAVILAAESGGRFTDPDGGTRPDLHGGVYSNGHLHGDLLAAIDAASLGLGGRPSDRADR